MRVRNRTKKCRPTIDHFAGFSAESSRCKFDLLPEWRYNSCHGQPYCETADRNSLYGSEVSSLIQVRPGIYLIMLG